MSAAWAAEQSPPVTLPGDDGRIVPPLGLPGARSVHVPARRPAPRLPREADMNSAIEKLDAEIASLQAEVAYRRGGAADRRRTLRSGRGRAALGRARLSGVWPEGQRRASRRDGASATAGVDRRLHGRRCRQALAGRTSAYRGARRRSVGGRQGAASWTSFAARSCAPRPSVSSPYGDRGRRVHGRARSIPNWRSTSRPPSSG